MNPRLVPAVCAAGLLLLALPGLAQSDPTDDPLEAPRDEERELTWSDYAVKAYTIQVFGGWFGGSEYLNLPLKGPRTYLQELDRVMGYNGEWWPNGDQEGQLDYNIYDSPIKTIEDGQTFGLKIGSYLTEQFHLDIYFSYTATEAVLTMINTEDEDNLFRTEIDRDPDVQILRGALLLTYDLDTFDIFGFSPYMGLGFGGILNRFSNLPDVGGLFLMGAAGLNRPISGNVSAFVQGDLTAFSMSRDELHYTKSVVYKNISAGISLFFDTVPPDIRALRESQLAERRRR